jgi:glycosyltransferase involved in cell wall biosynthesis
LIDQWNPVLTIAIPTYNRAFILKETLRFICWDLSKLESNIELLIIDNCSTDNTPEVLSEMQKKYRFLRVLKNQENIGATNNVIECMKKSQALYTWIIGDDDLVLPGAVTRLLGAIQNHGYPDFIVTGLSIFPRSEVLRVGIENYLERNSNISSRYTKYNEDRLVDFEDLIDPIVDEVFLGALMISIFKTKVLKNAVDLDDYFTDNKQPYTDLISTYPHAYLFGKSFTSLKALYISKPLIAALEGKKEWDEYLPLIVIMRLGQLLDHYQECGISKSNIDDCRASLLVYFQGLFWKIAFENKPSLRQDFRFFEQIRKYARFKEFWISILGIRKVKRLLRRVKSLRKYIHNVFVN